MDKHTPERREYFRVDDNAKYTLTKINKSDTLESLSKKNTSFLLGSSIATLDMNHQTVISKIKRSDPDTAAYLDVINQKIKLISNYILENDPEMTNQQTTEINLSASGIAVSSDLNVQADDLVEIKLVLLPELIGILCIGSIKKIEKQNTSNLLHIDFTAISEADQEIIIKHNTTRQLELARAKHELD